MVGMRIQPSEVLDRLENFYAAIHETVIDDQSLPGIYYKAALQASNDRNNRVRRGIIVSGILQDDESDTVISKLRTEGLA
jgi:hypothetical protein